MWASSVGGAFADKRILVTRPADEARMLAALLQTRGAQPVVVPTIAFAPPDDLESMLHARRDAGKYRWCVFTSARGVEAFFDSAIGTEIECDLAAIGPATARTLAKRGLEAKFVPHESVGEAVAQGLIERTNAGERVLLFRAQEARSVIPETLRAHGRIVDDVAAYKTVVRRDPEIAAAARTTDAWTFTSASTVDGLAANLPDLGVAARGRVIVAIGPITAQSLRRYGLEADAVAGRATVEGLVTTLEALFARRER